MSLDYLLRAALQPVKQPESRDMLQQCVASGQVDAGQVHQHVVAGEVRRDWDRPGYDATDFTVVPSILQRLQQELADDAAQHMVETWAAWVPSTAPGWVYDVSALDNDFCACSDDLAGDLEALARAVRYLDLRQLLHRPIAGQPQFVSFRRT